MCWMFVSQKNSYVEILINPQGDGIWRWGLWVWLGHEGGALMNGIEPLKKQSQDFPGGAVVKNPPANAGDMGSSPGPGRSHMLWSN